MIKPVEASQAGGINLSVGQILHDCGDHERTSDPIPLNVLCESERVGTSQHHRRAAAGQSGEWP